MFGNLNDSKIDRFISLHLYGELYRFEENVLVEANMDDENKGLI